MSTQAEARAPSVSNASLDDKSFANRARGFAAGVASGITKLAVGHPFGNVTSPPTFVSSKAAFGKI
jgi:solute carrier family 25 carnitine/acylcarnitine transporter 20/29